MNRFRITLLAVALSALASQALAADASKLGTELTPIGAEKAANKAGTIPAWPGNEVQQTGWSYGELRGQHFKYKDDKPLYTIDGADHLIWRWRPTDAEPAGTAPAATDGAQGE